MRTSMTSTMQISCFIFNTLPFLFLRNASITSVSTHQQSHSPRESLQMTRHLKMVRHMGSEDKKECMLYGVNVRVLAMYSIVGLSTTYSFSRAAIFTEVSDRARGQL